MKVERGEKGGMESFFFLGGGVALERLSPTFLFIHRSRHGSPLAQSVNFHLCSVGRGMKATFLWTKREGGKYCLATTIHIGIVAETITLSPPPFPPHPPTLEVHLLF